MVYKVFFACCVGTFVMAIEKVKIVEHSSKSYNSSEIKFGFPSNLQENQTVLLFPHCIILSLIGGFLGSLFIILNTKCNKIRKTVLKT